MADAGMGLEALAEDGDPSGLFTYLDENSGFVSPFAPGVWAVHTGDMPLFTDGVADYNEGLEALSEDGNPATLATSLQSKTTVISSGVFNTPSGASGPGPLMPGSTYEFIIEAEKGQYLSFATMLVHTNDLFLAPSDDGLTLWNGASPVSGDITSNLYLWDAGTEMNEYPGAGIHQPARLNGGVDETMNIQMVNDGFVYPLISDIIKVTITPM